MNLGDALAASERARRDRERTDEAPLAFETPEALAEVAAAASATMAEAFAEALAESPPLPAEPAPPKRHRLTASGIGLGRLCLWWARADITLPESDDTASATLGTALHETAESESDLNIDDESLEEAFRRLVRGGAEDDAGATLTPSARKQLAALASAWRDWWAAFEPAIDRSDECPPLFSTELAFALDVDTGKARVLDGSGHRDYSDATAREVCGTIDLVSVIGGRPHVDDYKTGQGPHGVDDHLDQLLFGAAAQGIPEPITIGIPWVTADGVRYDSRTVRPMDLAIFVAELRGLVDVIPTATAKPGLHCAAMYCPAKAVCPETMRLAIGASIDLDTRRHLPLAGPITTNADAHAWLVALPLIEALLADRKKAARAFADEAGCVTAPDGSTYKAHEETRESPKLEVKGAREALAAIGLDAAIEVTESLTWDAVQEHGRRLKRAGEKVVLKDLVEDAKTVLREAGALKVGKFVKYRWKKPAKGKA